MKKRIFSMLIVVCMVFTMLPSTAFATWSTPIGASNVDSGAVCENHKEHTEGEDGCGFIEDAEGSSCKHECELCSTQAAPPVEEDSTLPPTNAPSEEQTRNETPCNNEAEGILYLDEIVPVGTELTAKQQALVIQ